VPENTRLTCTIEPVQLAATNARRIPVTLMRAGPVKGRNLNITPAALQAALPLFEGVPCLIGHSDFFSAPDVHDLAGHFEGAAWNPQEEAIEATLALNEPTAQWLQPLIDAEADRPWFGLSADTYIQTSAQEVIAIQSVNSVDVVLFPAAGGKFRPAKKEQHSMPPETSTPQDAANGDVRRIQTAGTDNAPPTTDAPQPQHAQASAPPATAPEPTTQSPATNAPQELPNDLRALMQHVAQTKIAASGLPETAKDRLRARFSDTFMTLDELDAQIEDMKSLFANVTAQGAIQGLGEIRGMRTSVDRIELAFERLMGLPETAEHRDVPRLSGIREMYDIITGDWERHGVFRGDRVQFANATTATMANVCANVMNKSLLRAFEQRPKWWAPIAFEEDFQNMNDARWITLGGFTDLDLVAEGGPYTEKTWDDNVETAPFTKMGNYIGVTLEMIDRDDVAAVRAIPRKLGLAAYRTLSADVAALFTDNAGVGPDLSDTHPLFNDANHHNLGTTALSAAEWQVVITAMFQQEELNSAKRLGVRPRYCLVPIELEKTALEIFTSDLDPDGGTWVSNVLKRTASNVIVVPEWTVVDHWAAAADPADLEGVCIGYRFGRAPELFTAQAENEGAMFTNDELRIKARFVYAVGIGDYRALYKENV
jgi:hypothetical protein